MWIIVGLGNPGRKYQRTRHNTGFLVVEEFVRRNRIPWKGHGGVAEVARLQLAGQEILVVKPMVFMNRSGEAVAPILRKAGKTADSMVVVHDDMDLAFGRIKIREGGGSGGHRGVQSLMDCLPSDDFVHLKLGIGRPGTEESPEDYVLSRFSPDQVEGLPLLVASGTDALDCIVREGLGRAMNRFNIQRQWNMREEKEGNRQKKAETAEVEEVKPKKEEKEGPDG